MSNQQILEKAIKKAQANGYAGYAPERISSINKHTDGDYYLKYINQLLFNHDFAKALWPSNKIMPYITPDKDIYKRYEWQLHLMEMVIAPDPIKYLGDNL